MLGPKKQKAMQALAIALSDIVINEHPFVLVYYKVDKDHTENVHAHTLCSDPELLEPTTQHLIKLCEMSYTEGDEYGRPC